MYSSIAAGVDIHLDPDITPAFARIHGRMIDYITADWKTLEPAELCELVSVTQNMMPKTDNKLADPIGPSTEIGSISLKTLQEAAEYRITAGADDARMRYADHCYDVRATKVRVGVLRCRRQDSLDMCEGRAPLNVHSDSEDGDEGGDAVDAVENENSVELVE